MSIPIKFDDLPMEIQRREKSILAAIRRGIRNGARGGRAVLVRRSPKDLGQLKNSWRDTASRPGTATMTTVAEVFNDAPYAGIVELGARPHPVSREGQLAILEWVQRHFRGEDEKAQRRIARAIVHKIRREGQRPTYFVRDSLGDLNALAAREVARAVDRQASGSRKGGA